jgi:hypothetical protein
MRLIFLAALAVFAMSNQAFSQQLLRCEQLKREIFKEGELIDEARQKFLKSKAEGDRYLMASWIRVAESSVERLQPLITEGRRLPCLRHVDFDAVEITAIKGLRALQ